MRWSISGADILTPSGLKEESNISFVGDTIEQISDKKIKTDYSLNLEGLIVPGLINSHDHLIGSYYPKIVNGPYLNYLPWHNDLRHSEVYAERRLVDDEDLYLLGAYKNLISGVTTVFDHIPPELASKRYDRLPVKTVRDFTMAHSIAPSFSQKWGREIGIEYAEAVRRDIPFVTHISEGFDEETINDVKRLESEKGLGSHSVLVHGISFSEEDISLISKCGASVVWCGVSNIDMFEKTTNIEMLLKKGVNTCIGTDSSFSGGRNLLDEMRFDKEYYKNNYGREIGDDIIYKMVTENAAKAIRKDSLGKLVEGYTADLVLLEDKGKSPYSSLVSTSLSDIKLVIMNGKPMYGDDTYSELFEKQGINYQQVMVEGSKKIIVGDVIGLLNRISSNVGFKKTFPFLPVEFDFN